MVLAPVAAAIVVVLASTGSPSTSPGAAGSEADAQVLARQASASVTRVQAEGAQGQQLRPAVRVAATTAAAGTVAATVSDSKVPSVLLAAYRSAAGSVPASCHLQVSLLAAIGEVESGSLAGRPLDAQHRTSVLGPVLDGNGFASIPDTDKGRWDGDATWDRAMGPMQFVPSTWRSFGVDGDGDGVAHPQDVEDAAASAGAYLCYGGRDLAQPDDLKSAIWSYNHSTAYEKLVMTYQQRYAALGLDSGVTASLLPTISAAVSATPVGGLGIGSSADDGSVPARTRMSPAASTRGPGAQPSTRTPARSSGATPTRTPATTPPTRAPGVRPSGTPTKTPSQTPSQTPGGTPTKPPSQTPSGTSTKPPSQTPSQTPSAAPTKTPGSTPTKKPSATPSRTPSPTPSQTPSQTPSATPTVEPTCPVPTPGDALTAAIPVAPGEDGPSVTCPPCPGTAPTPAPALTDEVCEPVPPAAE